MSENNVKLLGEGRLKETLQKALGHSQADQTLVSIETGQRSLTRFAGSVIHQNVSERNAGISVRAIIGKKIGYAVSNAIDEAGVRQTVEKAVEFARNQQENPDFVSLPGPKPVPEAPQTFFDATAKVSPEDRAGAVETIVGIASKQGADVAGSFSTNYSESAIASSLGTSVYNAGTMSNLSMVMTAGTGFGYSNRISRNAEKIDAAGAAEEAVKRAVDSKDPISIEAGEYDVVLTPYCVEDFVSYLNWLGFSALAVQESRSFMAGKFGQKVCGENITIWDDGFDPRGIVHPFDGEGVPKQRVDLIVNGVANAVVYDSYTANKEGKESTGHSTGGTGTHGPYAWNMLMAPGEASIEDMIASTKKGLFVTRFNYTNVVHPLLTIITGMTRDGTFLIEDGKITKPVKNLRFTESVLNALSNVEMIGKDLVNQGSATVPALKIKNFRFTGTTEF
jgi:predicted Zn-dependent protease